MNIKKNYLINRNSALQRSSDIRFTYFAKRINDLRKNSSPFEN